MNIRQRFSIQTLGEYNDIYLKTDVLLLADIFKNFQNNCQLWTRSRVLLYTIGFYVGRDVETRVNFELHTDVVLFIERGIRGSLSQCSQVRTGQQHTVI